MAVASMTNHAQSDNALPGTPGMLSVESRLWALGYLHVAGIDEAGRGPLAGPVVAACVVFPVGMSVDGVRDSKKLTASRRQALFQVIMDKAMSVGVGMADEKEIDQTNILAATLKAMKRAFDRMVVRPDYVLVDGLNLPVLPCPGQTMIRGDDQSQSIAAASIIAKVSRDRLMLDYDRQWPAYGFAEHKGYGTERHLAALAAHGPCPIHRRTFAPLRPVELELFAARPSHPPPVS